MQENDATDFRIGDLHIGDLKGHAYGESEVQEVTIRGYSTTGENEWLRFRV